MRKLLGLGVKFQTTCHTSDEFSESATASAPEYLHSMKNRPVISDLIANCAVARVAWQVCFCQNRFCRSHHRYVPNPGVYQHLLKKTNSPLSVFFFPVLLDPSQLTMWHCILPSLLGWRLKSFEPWARRYKKRWICLLENYCAHEFVHPIVPLNIYFLFQWLFVDLLFCLYVCSATAFLNGPYWPLQLSSVISGWLKQVTSIPLLLIHLMKYTFINQWSCVVLSDVNLST